MKNDLLSFSYRIFFFINVTLRVILQGILITYWPRFRGVLELSATSFYANQGQNRTHIKEIGPCQMKENTFVDHEITLTLKHVGSENSEDITQRSVKINGGLFF